MEKAVEEEIRYSKDNEVREIFTREFYLENLKYDYEELGLEQGLAKGLKQGHEQGLEQKSIEIAKNMLDMDMDTKIISKATGLSLEEINDLKS